MYDQGWDNNFYGSDNRFAPLNPFYNYGKSPLNLLAIGINFVLC